MKLRSARKVIKWMEELQVYSLDWFDLDEQPLYRKAQKRLEREGQHTFERTMHIIRLLELGREEEAHHLWSVLRKILVARFRKNEVITLTWGDTFETMYSHANTLALESIESAEDVSWDLSYYSDRWCAWRVGVVDRRLKAVYGWEFEDYTLPDGSMPPALYDTNGDQISLGDTLHSVDGYSVVVCGDEPSWRPWTGKLVCEPGHSCENIPYSLNGGSGHSIERKEHE